VSAATGKAPFYGRWYQNDRRSRVEVGLNRHSQVSELYSSVDYDAATAIIQATRQSSKEWWGLGYDSGRVGVGLSNVCQTDSR